MSAATLKAFIADDEPPARAWLRRQLEGHPEIRIVGEAEDGYAAVSGVERERPDVLFLDVQMPGLDGFGVLDLVEDRPPAVVLVTAFDRYAVRAYEVGAVDYLVKPFSRARFDQALERVRNRVSPEAPAPPTAAAATSETAAKPEWLLVREDDRSRFVRVRDIEWIEADGGAVLLHAGGKVHGFSATMSDVEKALDPGRFVRIHRSTIVNVERVAELQRFFHGEYRVVLKDGTVLTLSAHHRDRLARFRKLPA